VTYKVTLRGSPGRTIAAEFECPAHGRFEADVERDANGEAPDCIRCPIVDDAAVPGRENACDEIAEYRISSPLCRVRRIEAIKGKSEKPERETWTDTRNIAEGQPLYDWHEDRAAVWERKRQRDVVAFAREHNERIRSDD